MQQRHESVRARRLSTGLTACAVGVAIGLAALPPAAGADDAAVATEAAATPAAFGFEDVQQRARDLAAEPFDDRAIHLEDWLQQFDYDDYREIEYRREKALWEGTDVPFRVQFFHRGGIFPNPVKVHVIREGGVEDFKFDPDLFNYRALEIEGQVPEGLGFAGFKALTPLNADHFDEVLSFLGASYFRALGKGTVYGLSSRGLAINSSKWGHEEFPWFREFWLEAPTAEGEPLRAYALLDSQSLTGAYRFELRPGDPTTLDVKLTLYVRKDVEELGLAPLTSMYLFGETDPWPAGVDFRPEVHDSDGLAIHYAHGERLWRPLQNPKESLPSEFPVEAAPRGFGLMQRDRDFGNYHDLEAVYQRRPSCWIEPLEGFGAGKVKLLELSSNSEANDSTVSYFVPAEPVKAGQTLNFAYRMHWGGEAADALSQGGGYVVSSRPSQSPENPDGATRFVLEFAGPALASLDPSASVSADLTVDGGETGPAVVQHNPYAGTWRLFFDVTPSGSEPAAIRVYLKDGEHVLGETWSFRCVP